MENSICKFMPSKNYNGNIKIINFVYETELKRLKQPFLHPVYYIYLVTNGSGMLKMGNMEHELKPGYVFFTFPAIPFEINGSDNFRFIYISFLGAGVGSIFDNLGIGYETPVYQDFDNMMDFWLSSISRINQLNANILAESVLLYTLSFINNKDEPVELKSNAENRFDMIVDYIDNHFKEHDISLKKIATVFSYTEKYLSHLFKKNMQTGFSNYINHLRMQYAHQLLDCNVYSITEIASLCGYSDSLYFSKVFKKWFGMSPNEYLRSDKTGCFVKDNI